MTYVVQKDPDLVENQKFSPWKGCMHVEPDGVWHATSLSKPTQFDNKKSAGTAALLVREKFPTCDIRIAIYEEVFQLDAFAPQIPEPVKYVAVKKELLPDWDWNGDDDIPF